MQYLRELLDTVFTNEEMFNKSDEENSNHDSTTKLKLDLEMGVFDSIENDCFIQWDNITNWIKKKFYPNVRVSVKNIITKTP